MTKGALGSFPDWVSANAPPVEVILTFADLRAKLNDVRNADSSLRLEASGRLCLGLSRNAAERSHFLPTEEGVIAWSSFFAPRRTFGIHVAHLEGAFAVSGLDCSWRAEAASIARHGLARSGDEAFSPRPTITT